MSETGHFRLSVVTVCLNSERTIGRTLQSLREQTDKRFESIVIDGGSTDGTLALIEEYKDVVTTLISEKDGGIYAAMNKGIAMAGGGHISFLNSDDAYLPHTVSAVAEAAEVAPKSILYGNMIKERELEGRILTRSETPDLSLMPRTMGLFHPATFTPTKLFRDFGPYDTRFSHAADYHWFLRAYLAGGEFHFIDRELAVFRLGGASTGSCVSYREAALIQKELRTGHHEEMERNYRHCRWKLLKSRMLGTAVKVPFLRDVYVKQVKKRWQ